MMLPQLHTALTMVHVCAGAFALFCFWIPLAARKGGALHRRAGRWFLWSMYLVTATAVVISGLVLIAPLSVRMPTTELEGSAAVAAAQSARGGALFLLMLSLLVLSALRQGRLALDAVSNPARLRTPTHLCLLLTLALTAVASGVVGLRLHSVLLVLFATVSVLGGGRLFYEALRGRPPAGGWIVVHLRGMIVGGIGAYTAFFVFGGRELLAGWLVGHWALVPWILPSLLGALLIRRFRRAYARRTHPHVA